MNWKILIKSPNKNLAPHLPASLSHLFQFCFIQTLFNCIWWCSPNHNSLLPHPRLLIFWTITIIRSFHLLHFYVFSVFWLWASHSRVCYLIILLVHTTVFGETLSSFFHVVYNCHVKRHAYHMGNKNSHR